MNSELTHSLKRLLRGENTSTGRDDIWLEYSNLRCGETTVSVVTSYFNRGLEWI